VSVSLTEVAQNIGGGQLSQHSRKRVSERSSVSPESIHRGSQPNSGRSFTNAMLSKNRSAFPKSKSALRELFSPIECMLVNVIDNCKNFRRFALVGETKSTCAARYSLPLMYSGKRKHETPQVSHVFRRQVSD
jgi:hypothetical protein